MIQLPSSPRIRSAMVHHASFAQINQRTSIGTHLNKTSWRFSPRDPSLLLRISSRAIISKCLFTCYQEIFQLTALGVRWSKFTLNNFLITRTSDHPTGRSKFKDSVFNASNLEYIHMQPLVPIPIEKPIHMIQMSRMSHTLSVHLQSRKTWIERIQIESYNYKYNSKIK